MKSHGLTANLGRNGKTIENMSDAGLGKLPLMAPEEPLRQLLRRTTG